MVVARGLLRRLIVLDPSSVPIGMPTIAGLVPVTDIMTPDPICAARGVMVDVIVDLILRKYIGCIPVVDETRSPIGMITKRDLLERLARGEPASSLCAGDVMLPLAFSIPARSTVAQAAALMIREDVHHLPVVSGVGRVIGIVSTLDIVRWLARNDGLAA